jgi:hypothetical protein|tara:strand:+ start:206 stop:589 length:384 start_codon:yes stop_codon:yes gene_type:complete
MSDKNLNNSLNFHNKFLDKGSQRVVLIDDSEDINELHKNISSFIYLVFSNSVYRFNKESKFEKSIEKKSFFNENEFIPEITNNNEILYYSTEWSKSIVNLSEENLFSESYEISGTLTENNVISYLDI